MSNPRASESRKRLWTRHTTQLFTRGHPLPCRVSFITGWRLSGLYLSIFFAYFFIIQFAFKVNVRCCCFSTNCAAHIVLDLENYMCPMISVSDNKVWSYDILYKEKCHTILTILHFARHSWPVCKHRLRVAQSNVIRCAQLGGF